MPIFRGSQRGFFFGRHLKILIHPADLHVEVFTSLVNLKNSWNNEIIKEKHSVHNGKCYILSLSPPQIWHDLTNSCSHFQLQKSEVFLRRGLLQTLGDIFHPCIVSFQRLQGQQIHETLRSSYPTIAKVASCMSPMSKRMVDISAVTVALCPGTSLRFLKKQDCVGNGGEWLGFCTLAPNQRFPKTVQYVSSTLSPPNQFGMLAFCASTRCRDVMMEWVESTSGGQIVFLYWPYPRWNNQPSTIDCTMNRNCWMSGSVKVELISCGSIGGLKKEQILKTNLHNQMIISVKWETTITQ